MDLKETNIMNIVGEPEPKHIDIHRKEIYMAIQEENNQAASISADLLTKLNQQMNQKL